MSKKSNVNPGQYKVGGREKPDTMASERMKQRGQEKVSNAAQKRGAPKSKSR